MRTALESIPEICYSPAVKHDKKPRKSRELEAKSAKSKIKLLDETGFPHIEAETSGRF
jgi:hypothetical protein